MLFPEQFEGSGFDVIWKSNDASARGLLALVSLTHTWRGQAAPFNHDVHHRGFWPKQLMAVWSLLLHGDSEGPPLISPTAWRSRVFLTQSNPDFLLGGRTSASAECRHWSGRAVRWSSCAIAAPTPAADDVRARRDHRAAARRERHRAAAAPRCKARTRTDEGAILP